MVMATLSFLYNNHLFFCIIITYVFLYFVHNNHFLSDAGPLRADEALYLVTRT